VEPREAFLWLLAQSVLFSLLSAVAAHARLRNPVGWALGGFLLGPLALLVVLVLGRGIPSPPLALAPGERSSTKECPACCADIDHRAALCRFCGTRQSRLEAGANMAPLVVAALVLAGFTAVVLVGRCG